jgi:hypothetical protein
MEGNHRLLEDAERSIRCKAQKFVTFVAHQLSQSENQARERAHLATRGDRPFVGCNPCQPSDPDILSGPPSNRAAAAHPDASEQRKS